MYVWSIKLLLKSDYLLLNLINIFGVYILDEILSSIWYINKMSERTYLCKRIELENWIYQHLILNSSDYQVLIYNNELIW